MNSPLSNKKLLKEINGLVELGESLPCIWVSYGNIICNGNGVDRTFSVPKSFLRLRVDKGQGLRSGILFFTSLVLLPIESRDES